MRRPKGYVRRYEIVRRPVQFTSQVTKDWWRVIKYYGKLRGAGVQYLAGGDPGADIPDEQLITRARLDSVTVPVYVIRDGVVSEPYFGKYYGQK